MNLFALLFFSVVSISVSAQELSPLVKLNRVSRMIRGSQPSDTERKELAQAVANSSSELFLANKLDEYLKTEAHAYKMSIRLEETFWLKTDGGPIEEIAKKEPTLPGGPQYVLYPHYNSLNDLFYRMARQNLSWDTLLTGKSYRAYNTRRSFYAGLSDYGFFGALVPELKTSDGIFSDGNYPTENIDHRDISFNANEKQIAGALTTARFFTRYVNTGLNKNRKRAAAIFRIFLCDSMSAAIPSSDGKDDSILDLMYPHKPGDTEEALRRAIADTDAIHGQRADCMACHYKLDPMGRTFMTSPLVLSPKASPGKLTYKRTSSDLVDVPVSGLSELGQAITQQPEYARCQVRHFWKWFMGQQPLTSEKENLLVEQFNSVGRRTNDFIKVLAMQKEFYTISAPLTEDQLRIRQIKTLMQKCQNCHKDSSEDIPDFTKWPIGGDSASMKKWLGRIGKKMDLARDGENPTMPPEEASWRTSFKDVQTIKAWIEAGAPDESGKPQVQP